MEPGIYFGLPAEDYHAAPGLSHSGMRDLAVSPLHYWARHLDPARRPVESTPAQRFGTALHYRIFEPAVFASRYGRKLAKDDFPGALVTIDDLKGWLGAMGLPTAYKRKQELVERVCAAVTEGVGHAFVWDAIVERHAQDNAGKELLDADDWRTLDDAAAVVHHDPVVSGLLEGGSAEVSIFVRDPETDVRLKCRIDYARPGLSVDLKSFSNPRRKPIKQAIDDAILYEGYFQQAVYYHDLRQLARHQLVAGDLRVFGDKVDTALLDSLHNQQTHAFAFVFVESSPPYGLDLVALKREVEHGPQSELYWSVARRRHRELISLYAECESLYEGAAGQTPWREAVRVRTLEDADMPNLMFRAGGTTILEPPDRRYDDEAASMPSAELEASAL